MEIDVSGFFGGLFSGAGFLANPYPICYGIMLFLKIGVARFLNTLA